MHRLIPTLLLLTAAALAAEPAAVRRVPPPGIAIPSADRAELTAGADALAKDIAALEKDLAGKPELLAQLPDVQLFHKAVDWALRYDEFFSPGQIAQARNFLELGKQRAAELRAGKPSWTSATGLVVRGYHSKIDGSIQPYGLVIPDDWKPGDSKPRPLHFWCHGRGEKLSELDFINGRLTSRGEYTPPGAFVIHLYGRYCCANKFAGEVDLFEAMENAAKRYPIDSARLVIRGFSMGGGSTWQFATHFAGMWAAANPGAGFGESKEFLKLGTAPDRPMPPEWEQKLWRWYDSTGSVSNLANTTTVAYSGEIDGQKQAADIMIRFARQEAGNANPPVAELGKVAPGDGSPKAEEARVAGTAPDLALYHVIAPNTPHKVTAEAKPEVEKLVEAAVEKGREAVPKKVHFTTYSLIYPRMKWITINAMEKQWERADVDAEFGTDGTLNVTTKNVREVTFAGNLQDPREDVRAFPENFKKVVINGQSIVAEKRIWYVHAAKRDGMWSLDMFLYDDGRRDGSPEKHLEPPSKKRNQVCGPIDHAFMSSFVFVRPSGKPLNKVVGDWVESELGHAVAQWRAVFRGDAHVVADTAVSADDMKNSNLILWGDSSSNAWIKFFLGLGAQPTERWVQHGSSPPERAGSGQVPQEFRGLSRILQWDGKQLVFAGKTYDAAHIAPILIFPNPLNPQHYVVLNSGFTMREAAALNNANQTPKLPDWAIVDLNTPPDAFYPGKILRAGFFDEQWQPPAQ